VASKAGQSVTVDGHLIKVSNLDKQLYPQTQTTKGEVLAYYAEVAAVMIPHVADRPATRKRWPDGVGTAESAGPVFFQKNLDSHAPDWVERRVIEHRDRDVTYPLVNDVATLVWLAQLAALEIHVPQWRFGREQQTHPSSRRDGGIHNPDRLVIDLDPGPGVGLPECVQVAQWTREILTGWVLIRCRSPVAARASTSMPAWTRLRPVRWSRQWRTSLLGHSKPTIPSWW